MSKILSFLLILFFFQSFSQPLPSYVPTNGLVAFYPLDQTSQARDISGQNSYGIIPSDATSNVFPSEDRFGDSTGAMTFENFKGYMTIDVKGVKWDEAFSVGGWYRTLAPDFGGRQPLFSVITLDLSLGYDELNNGCLRIMGDSIKRLISQDEPMLKYGWHFYVGTFDGNEFRLYVDGLLTNTFRPNAEFLRQYKLRLGNPKLFRIGDHADGLIEDLFIYNRVITAQEVQRLYGSGVPAVLSFQKSGFTLGYFGASNDNSKFPKVSSKTNPGVAAAINKALQMAAFNGIITPKNPGVLGKGGWFRYYIEMPTNRLFIVHVIEIVIDWNRRDSPSVERHRRYYFDALTGDQLYFRDFFNKGNDVVVAEVNKGLLKSMKETFGEGMDDESQCVAYVKSTWSSDAIRFGINPFSRKVSFVINDCGDQDPSGRDHFHFQTSLPWIAIAPTLSPEGKYYLDDGPPFPIINMSHTWTGVLGQNIHVTFVLRENENHEVIGTEVYDSFGAGIPLKGKYVNGVLMVSELDPKGAAVATFEAKLQDRKLVGSWTKTDKSKTLPFTASIAAE